MIPVHGWVSQFHHEMGVPSTDDVRRNQWTNIRESAMNVKPALERGDRNQIALTLAELVYTAYRTAILYDIYLDEAIQEVHNSNMTLEPLGGEYGKTAKGPNYQAPNMARATGLPVPREDVKCPTCEAIQFMLDVEVS